MKTATIHLRILDKELSATIPFPDTMAPTGVLPLAYTITDAVVDIAANASTAAGSAVSCKKGCGACCRQMVTVGPAEAHRLAALVASMPEERQTALRNRFAAAIQRMRAARLITPNSPDSEPILAAPPAANADAAWTRLLDAYFALRIPCPFLEDESCSIYENRPAICREYLVSSPAENCHSLGTSPASPPVTRIPLPLALSDFLADFGLPANTRHRNLPLLFILPWSQTHPPLPPQPTKTLLTSLLQSIDHQALTNFQNRPQPASS